MNTVLTKFTLWFNQLSKIIADQFSGKTLSLDLLAIVFFVVVVLLIAFSLGRTRILIAIVSTYVSAFIYLIFPWEAKLKSFVPLKEVFYGNLAVFVVFWLVSYLLLVHSVLRSRSGLGESSVFTVLLLSLVETGFLFSIAVQILKVGTVLKLSPIILKYFSGPTAPFIWMLLPLLAFFFLKRQRAV